MGRYLHILIMIVVELEDIRFGRVISSYSYLTSFAITIIFSIVVNKFMEKHLRNIQMVESLKSIE